MTTQSPDTMLYLHEEILLLALREQEGTVYYGSMYGYAMAGGILAELLLSSRVGIDPENPKKNWLKVINRDTLNNEILDECLMKVDQAKRRAAMKRWVPTFSRTKELVHRTAANLCELSILKADRDTVLLLFKRRIYPEIDPIPEKAIVERLRAAIFTDTKDVDPRTVILLALADSANLLPLHFDKKKLKARKDRIERVIDESEAGLATKEAIQAAQTAAIVAATTTPVIVTTG